MASSRHKQAVPRRAGLARPTRPSTPGGARRAMATPSPWRGRTVNLMLPVVGLVTLASTSAAVALQDAEVAPTTASASATTNDIIARAMADDANDLSRNAELPELPSEMSMDVTGTLVALQDDTDIHADADGDSSVLATVNKGDKVDVTGETAGDWTQIVYKDLPRWVATDAVAEKLPKPEPEPEPEATHEPQRGLSSEPCPKGNEGGLQPNAVKVLRAVCANFPQATSYGGMRGGGGDHATGNAVDIMLDPATGDQVAAFLQENQSELGVEYLIWQQRIWRPATSAGWRQMEDRGGETANHMDHVHVTVY